MSLAPTQISPASKFNISEKEMKRLVDKMNEIINHI